MSKKTSYLLGILLTIIIGTYFFWKQGCCPCESETKPKVVKPVIEPKPQKAILTPFGIKDVNDQLLLKMKDNFIFSKSNLVLSNSLSKDVDDATLKIKEYLDENGQKRFNITGFYTSDEENPSAYPNLGLARANTVKDYMTSKGVSAKLINTFGKLNDNLAPVTNADGSNDIIYKAIDFGIVDKNFEEATKDEEALKAACAALKASPLILYFKTSQATIVLTDSQREKFSKMKNCIDKLGAQIQVIGHTDATGNADYNVVLGQNRADFAKQYLINNGIPTAKIEAISKGQSDPISDNGTAAGRAKNRRTVITIK